MAEKGRGALPGDLVRGRDATLNPCVSRFSRARRARACGPDGLLAGFHAVAHRRPRPGRWLDGASHQSAAGRRGGGGAGLSARQRGRPHAAAGPRVALARTRQARRRACRNRPRRRGNARAAPPTPHACGARRCPARIGPYEIGRVHVHIGLACRGLGDIDGGRVELETSRRLFAQLGATTDLERVTAMLDAPPSHANDGLTTRELEVLRLVASGKTNRRIAADLHISEKTVARHVSNTKLDLSSRAAATAYAFTHIWCRTSLRCR